MKRNDTNSKDNDNKKKKVNKAKSDRRPRTKKRPKYEKSSDAKFSERDTVKETDSSSTVESKPNDVSWYSKDPQLLKDVASYSFNYPLGNRVRVHGGKYADNGAVAGIMTIYTSPSIGTPKGAHDPINVASRRIYAKIREANSGAKNYDSVDLMIYFLAIDSLFSVLEYMKRTYRFLNAMNRENWYFPMTAIYASGFDARDMQSHLSEFRTFINYSIARIAKFGIPKSLSYVARHMWMYSGLYNDDPDIAKAQTYMYVPEGFYKYTLDSESKGALKWVPLTRIPILSSVIDPDIHRTGSGGITYAQIVDYVNDMIEVIIGSQDMGLIHGDIMKAVGSENLITVAGIAEGETVFPIYSSEILDQINNLELVGRKTGPMNGPRSAIGSIYGDIVQSLDSMRQGDYLTTTERGYMYTDIDTIQDGILYLNEEIKEQLTNIYSSKFILNFEKQQVEPADVMVATRLTNRARILDPIRFDLPEGSYLKEYGWYQGDLAGGAFQTVLQSAGSDIARFAKIWYMETPNPDSDEMVIKCTNDIYSVVFTRIWMSDYAGVLPQIINEIEGDFKRVCMISQFDRHPAITNIHLCIYTDSDTGDASARITHYQARMNNLGNYTIIDDDDCDNMHKVALMSMFDV